MLRRIIAITIIIASLCLARHYHNLGNEGACFPWSIIAGAELGGLVGSIFDRYQRIKSKSA